METAVALEWIPLLPFLGAAFLILFGRRIPREAVPFIAVAAIGGAAIAGFHAFFTRLPPVAEEGGLHSHVATWMASGSVKINIAFRMDALSGVMTLIITGIGTLIHVYSMGYMAHEPDSPRFFAYLNLFCGAMLVLVLGDSLPLMFVGWEGVGLCSYLLIGFWYKETPNADAGKKAFITNRVGDFGFILGMLLLFQVTGTFDFAQITAAAREGGAAVGALTAESWLHMPVAFWIGLLLFIGATGKSAQIPLYVWLPDAMAGPTPVSALIHAATMVTAGVYMIARLSAVYVLSPAAMALVAVVGALTALFAAVIGFAQNDFKKVLAYSTVSQLGFMFAGVGTGNFAGGIFHLGTHAFFKAGLFLCAGSVMHAMSGSGDITKMGGLRKRIPWTFWVFTFCWAAICGIPFLSGFYSKDSIIAGAYGATAFEATGYAWVGKLVGALLTIAAAGTAFYMSRLYFLVFSGDQTRCDDHTREHIHESPWEMVGPLVLLAAGAILAGYAGFPGALLDHPHWNLLGHWLEPAVGAEPEIGFSVELGVMIVSTALAAAAIALGWVFYGGGYRQPAHDFAARFGALVNAARNKFWVDEAYKEAFIDNLRRLSRFLFRAVDRFAIDRLMVEGPARVTGALASVARSLQSGDGQRYLAYFAVGAAAVVFMSTRPAAPDAIAIEACGGNEDAGVLGVLLGDHVCVHEGLDIEVNVDPGGKSGRRLRYHYDFDGDKEWEQRDPVSPKATYRFDGQGTYTIRVRIDDLDWGTSRMVERKIRVKS